MEMLINELIAKVMPQGSDSGILASIGIHSWYFLYDVQLQIN